MVWFDWGWININSRLLEQPDYDWFFLICIGVLLFSNWIYCLSLVFFFLQTCLLMFISFLILMMMAYGTKEESKAVTEVSLSPQTKKTNFKLVYLGKISFNCRFRFHDSLKNRIDFSSTPSCTSKSMLRTSTAILFFEDGLYVAHWPIEKLLW